MEKVNKYELIFVLVNQGFTDTIIQAAKDKGARGATILNARGGAERSAEKDYGIVITPDKELVLILVNKDIKDAILTEINALVGIETKGMAIIGSIPADNVVGMPKFPSVGENEAKEVK